ncbi:MAG: nodulation protein NfeD [Chloroflexi bacterium]|nr:nodulation protein NfeD [Chloroflexota bacterium]
MNRVMIARVFAFRRFQPPFRGRRSVPGLLVAAALLLLSLARAAPTLAGVDGGPALVLQASGPVAQAMVMYIERGLLRARAIGAEVVIVQLNTPGGGLGTMESIIQQFRASEVPVVVFVAPRGAMAGSAGTLITLAGHAAAMAPETAIGAASPVGGQGEDLTQTESRKVKEIMRATVRALAANRPPEAVQLAESTIEEAKAASAAEALKVGLIDFIAQDVPDLLRQLDGFSVQTAFGSRTLHTASSAIQVLNPSLIEELLQILTNPTVAFLLLTIGAQALLIELSSPGGWVAGFVGVVSLALAFYALGVLPVNWFGLAFIVLAFVLFILEVKAPTHGGLALAGTLSLVVGALVLFNSPGVPRFARVSIPAVIATSIVTAALFITVVGFAIRAQRLPVVVGSEALIGQIGEARSVLAPGGMVHLGGELWSAELEGGDGPLESGQQVEVIGVQGLKLRVRRPPA